MRAIYDSQVYYGNASRPFYWSPFMIPQYAQNGLVPFGKIESADATDFTKSRKKRNQMSFTMKVITS